MLSKKWAVVLATAIVPCIWGTTFFVTAEFLPPGRPLLAAVLRALPAGLLLLLLVRTLPRGAWWWKSLVLGFLNIGLFFALLFIAAYRLPGGVAATIGAIQPLLVVIFASKWIGEKLTVGAIIAGVVGIFGVALLVLQANARLDLWGVIAALAGAVTMSAGMVLTKRWGQPASPIATTSWFLIAGGLVLVPIMLLVEGPPPAHLSTENILGYLYLCLVGTAFAYALWFRGLHLLPAGTSAFLGLLSPLTATLIGWLLLHQTLTLGQILGALIILATLVVSNVGPLWRRSRPLP